MTLSEEEKARKVILRYIRARNALYKYIGRQPDNIDELIKLTKKLTFIKENKING